MELDTICNALFSDKINNFEKLMETRVITQPDDWHMHLRDGDALKQTVSDAAKQFARVIVMPNLKPPVTTVDEALAYRKRILAVLPKQHPFEPLMTLYLTNNTSKEIIIEAKQCKYIHAFKLYPAGATTHSEAGIENLKKIYPLLAVMEEQNIPLLIHGEVPTASVDIFDREQLFIDKQLIPLIKQFPHLRIVLEHITTAYAVDFIQSCSKNIAATITAHHLLLDRNDLLSGGVRPHYYCLPILKRHEDKLVLMQAACSGDPHFFLGTDSAPHAQSSKESACGCAGIYTAPTAIALYASVFEKMDKLDLLEGFASHFGANFYGLPRNQTKITLQKKSWKVPESLPFGKECIIPYAAGETLDWQIKNN